MTDHEWTPPDLWLDGTLTFTTDSIYSTDGRWAAGLNPDLPHCRARYAPRAGCCRLAAHVGPHVPADDEFLSKGVRLVPAAEARRHMHWLTRPLFPDRTEETP